MESPISLRPQGHHMEVEIPESYEAFRKNWATPRFSLRKTIPRSLGVPRTIPATPTTPNCGPRVPLAGLPHLALPSWHKPPRIFRQHWEPETFREFAELIWHVWCLVDSVGNGGCWDDYENRHDYSSPLWIIPPFPKHQSFRRSKLKGWYLKFIPKSNIRITWCVITRLSFAYTHVDSRHN